MFWKVYSIFYLLLGIPSCSALLGGTAHSGSWNLDVALSLAASYTLLKFAYGKAAHNFALWRLIAVSFIAADLYVNVAEGVTNQDLLMLGIYLPAYVGVILYANGKTARAKAKAPNPGNFAPIDLFAEEEAIWAEIEKRHRQALAVSADDPLKTNSSPAASSPAGNSPQANADADSIVISTRTKQTESEPTIPKSCR
jgi:hypothetical protein